MKKLIQVSLLFLAVVFICPGLSAAAQAAPAAGMIIDIMQACRMPVDMVGKIEAVKRVHWRVEKYETPQWGADEYWFLEDPAELKRLGLKATEVSIEHGVFRAIYLTAADANDDIGRNLGYVGLTPADLTAHHSGQRHWHTATDKTGQVISVRENGTWFECFEQY